MFLKFNPERNECMTLFLTSSPCDNQVPDGLPIPCILDARNGFVDALAARWKPGSRCVIACADPDAFDHNDEMRDTFASAFAFHALTYKSFDLLDARNECDAQALVTGSDFILLAGGHVPTESAFFARIGLRRLLEGYRGIVMGISAGSMNAADVVYAQPEEPGESVDPNFERFIQGLGLTNLNILPHYQMVKDNMLDGRRLYEEITFEDSIGHAFLVLVDGSFVLEEEECCEVFGEAYLIFSGKMMKICEEGEMLSLYGG